MEDRRSYQTLEFWMSVAAMVVGALMASGAFGDESTMMKILGAASSILGALGYTAARTFQKASALKAKTLLPVATRGTTTEDPS